jgi:hypothetical protein
MVKTVGIAMIAICLLPMSSIAQHRGPFGGRPTYLTKATRTNSFKPQRNTPKPFIARRNAAASSFRTEKFTTSPFMKRQAAARGSFARK